MARLGVEDLSIAFGGLAALSAVSFEATDGEILALIGPNGAGKSTVFNVVTGLYRPSAGRVTFDGVDLLELPPHEIAYHGVARTFQNTEVFKPLTALEGISGFQSGILPPVTIGADHETQRQGFWVRVEKGRFKQLTDWLKSE